MASKRPIDMADWLRFSAAGLPRVSPNGRWVVYVVTSSNTEENRNESHLWLYDTETQETRRLTAGPKDREPVWDPTGSHIAFLAHRDGEDACYIIQPDGGEAKKVSSKLDAASNVTWSPDGKSLAVLAFRHQPESAVADLADALNPGGDGTAFFQDQQESALRLTHRYPFRFDAVGYYDGRRKHLHRIPLEGEVRNAEALTEGEYDVAAYAWHPSSAALTFAALRDSHDTHAQMLYHLNLHGERQPLLNLKGEVSGLAWSPDGRYLAWVGDDNSYGWGTENHLWLYDGQSKEVRNLTQTLDRQIGEVPHGDVRGAELLATPVWSPDGQNVYVEYHDSGIGQILSVSIPTGEWKPLLEDFQGSAHSPVAAADAIYFAGENFYHPAELFRVDLTGGVPVRKSHLNDNLLSELEMGTFERLSIERAGFVIEGWLGRPAEFNPDKTYPLILYIHGGPHGGFGQSFRHEYLMEMARGRLILFVNPRGSQGYGQAFAAACIDDWGGEDYQDLMAFLDHVIQQGSVDVKRMGVTGISYGGYMTNWVITHTGRFAAAISEMSVSNHLSMYTHSDIGVDFMQSEFHSSPWQAWERLWERSPIRYADSVTTPSLFVAGAEDHRCPPEQSEQMYVALLRRDIPTGYVRFPDAPHGFSVTAPPETRMARRRLMAAWWKRYL